MRTSVSLISSLAFIILAGFTISYLGGCQSRYRYPCQDPKNWNKIECNNDACKAEGDCTSHVLGTSYAKREDDPVTTETSPDESLDDTTKKNNSDAKTNISSKIQSSNPTIGLNKVVPAKSDSPEKSVEKITCSAGVTCTVGEAEQPLTMDTIVNTTEHNLAAG
jgi:hypothetical protein